MSAALDVRDIARIDIPADHRSLLDRVAELSRAGMTWREYLRAPALSGELQKLRNLLTLLLLSNRGIALIDVGEETPDDVMRLLLLLIGRALGKNVAPAMGAEIRPLFSITAADGDPTMGGTYAGNGRNTKSLALHTDGSGTHTESVDILALLCIRPAEQGGVSRFADALAARSRLSAESRAILGMPFPRIDPYNPSLPAHRLIQRPVFEAMPAGSPFAHQFSYHPRRLRDGVRLRDKGQVAPVLERAFDELDAALEGSAVNVPLRRGDAVFLNNRVIAHGRTEFRDSDRPRLLERLWIKAGGGEW